MEAGRCGGWRWTQQSPQHHSTGFGEMHHEDASETFTSGVRRIWQRNPAVNGSLAKDLPRLAHRVTIRTRTGSDVLPPSPPHGNGSCMGPEDTWTLVERLTLTLVQELEPHKLPDVGRGLVMIGNEVTDTTDLEMVVPHLITLLGRDSKALKALKMVDQGVVLLGVHHMKGGVTRGLLTKDVRSADGWQIGIDLYEHVQVYHKRREQSVDLVSGASNHFELEFEVRATFDREMTQLAAAGLRVQRLVCAPTMQPEMRLHLESRIMGDLIIL